MSNTVFPNTKPIISTPEGKRNIIKSDIIHVIQVLEAIRVNGGMDKETIDIFLDVLYSEAKIPVKSFLHASQIFHSSIMKGIDELLETTKLTSVGDEYYYRNGQQVSSTKQNQALPNMSQPKYKVTVLSKIFGVSRQAINNWTKDKGSYLPSYEFEGTAKFILEEDLVKKLKEKGKNITIDDAFRMKYEYKINASSIRNRVS